MSLSRRDWRVIDAEAETFTRSRYPELAGFFDSLSADVVARMFCFMQIYQRKFKDSSTIVFADPIVASRDGYYTHGCIKWSVRNPKTFHQLMNHSPYFVSPFSFRCDPDGLFDLDSARSAIENAYRNMLKSYSQNYERDKIREHEKRVKGTYPWSNPRDYAWEEYPGLAFFLDRLVIDNPQNYGMNVSIEAHPFKFDEQFKLLDSSADPDVFYREVCLRGVHHNKTVHALALVRHTRESGLDVEQAESEIRKAYDWLVSDFLSSAEFHKNNPSLV